MNDVACRSREFQKTGEMVRAFRLDLNGSAGFVPLGSGFALKEKFLLQLCDQLGIFTVCGCDDAEFLGQFQGLVQFAVIDAEKILVSQKDLK